MILRLLPLLTALLLAAPAAHAEMAAADRIIAALKSRGYAIVLHERTWLGRERVIAEAADHRRELVFVPGSGEILRDMITRMAQGRDSTAVAAVEADPPAVGGEEPQPGPPSAVVGEPMPEARQPDADDPVAAP